MVIVIALVIVTVIIVIGAHRLVNQVNAEFDNINGKAD